jgi:tetratricopeptide (TPR) repeat protein
MPKNPVLLSWAGRILFKIGSQLEQAKKLVAAAGQIDNQCIESLLFSGEIALHEKNIDLATTHLKNALHLEPTNQFAKDLLAKADPEGSARAEVDAMSSNLESINYYTLLGIDREAKRSQLQQAFHKKTRGYHPDRFFTCKDEELKRKAATLYKRTVEAYMVLKIAQKREEYDRQLDQTMAGESGAVRLKDAGDVVQRKERSDIQIQHPNAKKFYTLALTCMNQKNFNGAIMNLKMALTAEPGNEWISKKLAEAEKSARGE